MEVGDILNTKRCGSVEILEISDHKNVKVKFLRSGKIKMVRALSIRKGCLFDRSCVLIYGVGIHDCDQPVKEFKNLPCGKRVHSWECPYFAKWRDMLRRCYSEKELKRNPSYRGCHVSDSWKTYSNFKKWLISNIPEGVPLTTLHLDKDLKGCGKLYSEGNCLLIHQKINQFLISSGTRELGLRGTYLRGERWISQISDPFNENKKCYLGTYSNQEDAHLIWAEKKSEFANMFAKSEYCTSEEIKNILKSKNFQQVNKV